MRVEPLSVLIIPYNLVREPSWEFFVIFYVSTIQFHIVKVVGGHTQKGASQSVARVLKDPFDQGQNGLSVTTPKYGISTKIVLKKSMQHIRFVKIFKVSSAQNLFLLFKILIG